MTTASVLMVIAIAAAAFGFGGIHPGLAYGVFYATLGVLGVHILLNAIDEEVREDRASKSAHNTVANP